MQIDKIRPFVLYSEKLFYSIVLMETCFNTMSTSGGIKMVEINISYILTLNDGDAPAFGIGYARHR